MENSQDLTEHIAAHAKSPVVIFGNLQTSEFDLVDLHTCGDAEAVRDAMTLRGLSYIGIAGVVDGKATNALAETPDPATAFFLGTAVAQHLSARELPATLAN